MCVCTYVHTFEINFILLCGEVIGGGLEGVTERSLLCGEVIVCLLRDHFVSVSLVF